MDLTEIIQNTERRIENDAKLIGVYAHSGHTRRMTDLALDIVEACGKLENLNRKKEDMRT